MQIPTQELYASLDSSHWFRNAGWKGTIQDDPNVLCLSRWEEAIEACSAPSWEQIMRSTAALLFQAVVDQVEQGPEIWKLALADFQPIVADLLRRKAIELVGREKLPPVIVTSLAWTIQHALLEAEFQDTIGFGWYGALAAYLAKGHFACGWSGPWPDGGRLIIL